MIWHQLSGAQRNWAQWGPMDPSAQSPLLFSKAWRGRKFEHEDSVQIAVTLAREGESMPGEWDRIRLSSISGPSPFLFPSHYGKRHTEKCPTGIWCSLHSCGYLTGAQSKQEDEHSYNRTRKGREGWTLIFSHQGIIITVNTGSLDGSVSTCWGISSSLFLCPPFCALSLSLPSFTTHTQTHTHTQLKDIDKICYNEPLP